ATRQERLVSGAAWLGVLLKPSSSGAGAEGVLIQAVTPGGPAEKAGLKAGDLIIAIDGHSLTQSANGDSRESLRHTSRLLRRSNPGETIEVEYRRGAENQKAQVRLESRHSGWAAAFRDSRGSVTMVDLPGSWLELELATVTPDLGEYFGTKRGLLVLRSASA